MLKLTFVLLLITGTQFTVSAQLSSRDSSLVKEYFFTGIRDKTNENYARAIENFNKIIVFDPKNSVVYYERALSQLKLNDLVAAEVSIKKAISLEADNEWYLKLLAEVYKNKGDMDALVAVYTELINLRPEQESNYFGKSSALAFSGKLKESLAGYADIEKRFGASESLLKAKKYLSARLKDVPMNAGAPIENHLATGSLLLDQGLADSALKVFKAGKKRNPDGFELDVAIADAYLQQKNVPEASIYLKQALKVKMDDPKLYALYGDLLYRQGLLMESLEQYRLSLKLSDQLYYVWEQTLNIQNILRNYKATIGTANAALTLYPNQAIIYYYLAFAEHRRNLNKDAALHLETALQLDSENKDLKAMVWSLKAEILLDGNDLQLALKTFNEAHSYSPTNYLIFLNFSYYLALKSKGLNEAVTLISEAEKNLPNNNLVSETYSFILLKLRRYKEAKVMVEKALKNNGETNAVYLEHYGDVLFLNGEQEQALNYWIKARSAGGDTEILKQKINEKKYINELDRP